MKKILSFMTMVLAAASAMADPIDAAKAKALAQEFLVPGHTMTLVKTATRNMAKARKVGAAVAATSPYYIYSRGEGQGFVIVAGDDCVPVILGYTTQGDWDDATVPEALKEMLQCYSQAVEDAQVDGTNVSTVSEARQRRVVAAKVDIPPFVTSHWHQSSPYNDNCPTLTGKTDKALTGCVATAASQILYYWRKDLPSTLQAATPTYGYGDAPVTRSVPKGTPLKWELMKDSYSNEPTEYKQAVAEFVFATGAATWLTYGSSTSGNIEKIPYTFSTYFGMNGGTVHYRDSYSQASWSNLIYNELANGRPVMYTGVHPSNGGHAVFIHGYNASNDLFYFNFGWGNGYDGYYTTDQTTGMNGFCGSQSALIGAYPKTRNIDVDLSVPAEMPITSYSTVKVKVNNKSTLSLKGVYVFVSSSNKKPTSASSARAKDLTTEIPAGEDYTYSFSVKPISSGTHYVILTDADLNVLAQEKVEAVNPSVTFQVNDMSVGGCGVKEVHGDREYEAVYNSNNMYVCLNVTNDSKIDFDGSLRLKLYKSTDEGATWDEGTVKSVSSVVIPADATSDVSVPLISLTKGVLYKVEVVKSVSSTSMNYHFDFADNVDSVAYFILKDQDIAVSGFENGMVTCTGHWDSNIFASINIVKASAYKTHTSFDLTGVSGVSIVPADAVNPNALFYVAADADAKGTNVVKDGKCENLVLEPGYNFVPVADFIASNAEMTVDNEVGRWNIITCPFDAIVPDGIIVREIIGHRSSGISNNTNDVKKLEAGKSYLAMISSLNNAKVYGTNCKVSASVIAGTDTALVGTYTNTVTPSGAFMLDDAESQYFQPMDEGSAVEALRGYFYASDVKNKFRANASLVLDPSYNSLAVAISEAYATLEDNKDNVTFEAYEAYIDSIKEAEHVFSNRADNGMTLASQIKSYTSAFIANGETYTKSLEPVANCEVDFTSCIVNPSFEMSSTQAKGWTVGNTATGAAGSIAAKISANTSDAIYTVDIDGDRYLNNRYVYTGTDGVKDSLSVEVSQVVTGLVPGYYRLSVKVGSDLGNKITVFAGESSTTVDANSFGVHYLTEATIDSILVRKADGADDFELNIGIKAGDWFKADDFRLTYIARALSEQEVLGVENIGNEENDKYGIYTIQGVRVADLRRPGLYIIGGKKVSVK